MAAFNSVRQIVECPNCRSEVRVDVQFKYGNTWQLHYDIGDAALNAGGNDIGNPDAIRVVIDAVGHVSCPNCGYEGGQGLLRVRYELWVPEILAAGFRKFWRLPQRRWPSELMPEVPWGHQARGDVSASMAHRV